MKKVSTRPENNRMCKNSSLVDPLQLRSTVGSNSNLEVTINLYLEGKSRLAKAIRLSVKKLSAIATSGF